MPITKKLGPDAAAGAAAAHALFNDGDPKKIKQLLKKFKDDAADAIPAELRAVQQHIRDFFGSIATTFSSILEDDLEALGHIRPGQAKAEFAKAIGDAFEFGIGAHLIAFGAEAAYPLKHIGAPTLAALAAEFSGFKELVRAYHGPLLTHAIQRPSNADHAAKFRSTPPPPNVAATWWARRLITDAQRADAIAWGGLIPDYEPAATAAAYRPVSPRALVQALQDTPFPAAQLRAILEDNAMAPANVDFMLQVLEYNSTKNVRNSYVSELLTAHAAGVVSEQELTNSLDGLGWSNAAIAFVQQRAALQRRLTLAKKTEASVIPLVAAGQLSPQEGTLQMETAGIQPWYTDLEITFATTKATVTALRKELAAEAKLAVARTRALTTAATKAFQDGTLDAAGLSVALLAAGLDPVIAASAVAAQEAQQTGRLRLTYGQLLTPQASKVLSDRVNAIGAQVVAQLRTADDALAELTLLNVDVQERNALVAKWMATIKKSVGPVVLINPVTGQPQK